MDVFARTFMTATLLDREPSKPAPRRATARGWFRRLRLRVR